MRFGGINGRTVKGLAMSDINLASNRRAARWQRGLSEVSGPVDAALDAAAGNGTVLGVAAMGATSKGLAYAGFFRKADAHCQRASSGI